MKYYIIVGEASGDLHASHLMKALLAKDPAAEFRFFGGDMMSAVGGTRVRHYRDLAYMGFIAVALHLRTILRNMTFCKRDIVEWQPDVVILVDYPGFNLKIAKYVHEHTNIPVYYYISPKIWAWKEYRIKDIKSYVDSLFSILPFEVPFFEQKHHYPIHYVGNPTAEEVRQFKASYNTSDASFRQQHGLDERPIIALLAGSRKQEIKGNLPKMIAAARSFAGYQLVLAAAPGIEPEFYDEFIGGSEVRVVHDETYALLSHAHTALVTSGTATLETALFRVPQVVCYDMVLPQLIGLLRPLVLKVKYVSLVNLIANREVVPELVANTFSEANIKKELTRLLPDGEPRQRMLAGYESVWKALGDNSPSQRTAEMIYKMMQVES